MPLRPSRAAAVLGPPILVPVRAQVVPGAVLWCNFALARELGLTVPASNILDRVLEQELVSACSVRVLDTGAPAPGSPVLTLAADRYGGTGVSGHRGAGRAAFHPAGDLYVKGIGRTPLAGRSDFDHSHGGASLQECIAEAFFSEVFHCLFTAGSTRVLAIIDQGMTLTFPNGLRRVQALLVRTGAHYRPGHLLAPGLDARERRRLFLRIARGTGMLVERARGRGRREPDLEATMRRLIAAGARTAAEQYRWRVLHGGVSPSNCDFTGAMLDLSTASVLPRTSPMRTVSGHPNLVFGREHLARADVFQVLYESLGPQAPGLDCRREFLAAYRECLGVELLGALGLKAPLARRFASEHPELTGRFRDALVSLASFANAGFRNATRYSGAEAGMVDVFGALAVLPEAYFRGGREEAGRVARQALKVRVTGRAAGPLRRRIARAREAWLGACCDILALLPRYARAYYGSQERMRARVAAKAAFENAAVPSANRPYLQDLIRDCLVDYAESGSPRSISELIGGESGAALRNTERLIRQGRARRVGRAAVLQERTLDGVDYCVRLEGPRARAAVQVSIPLQPQLGRWFTRLPGRPSLRDSELRSAAWRYTLARGGEEREVPLRVERGALVATLKDVPFFGYLEGRVLVNGQHLARRGAKLQGYAFAVPDTQDLRSLLRELE